MADLTERTFAINMRKLRKQLGWSQNDLARNVYRGHGVRLDSAAITRLEKHADEAPGARVIRLGEAAVIASVLGSSLIDMAVSHRPLSVQLERAEAELLDLQKSRTQVEYQYQDALDRVHRLREKLEQGEA